MKKVFSLSLVLAVLVGCLAACNVQSNLSGALAGAAESTPKVEEMMQALAENRASDAKALLHPQKAEQAEAALTQLSAYLAGRKADVLEQININIKTFSGASGKNTLHETLRKGRTVRAAGLLHIDESGETVIRVRNCDEVVDVPPDTYINPKTGDPIGIAVAGMALSGAALLLLKRKKEG